MAINLLGNIFQNGMNSPVSNGENINNAIQASNADLKLSLLNELNLTPGQILEGKFISKDGNSVQLLLNNNLTLTTSLETDANLIAGQKFSFEIKGNNKDGQLVLRPLMSNTNFEQTAVRALGDASVNVTKETLSMVDNLMKEGMPINKETLQNINREINQYPGADVKDIVMLHKMDMPVNEQNIKEMHLYQNNNQWMMENVSELSDSLLDTIISSKDLGKEGFDNLIDELKNALSDENVSSQSEGKTIIREDNDENSSQNIFDTIKKLGPDRIKNSPIAMARVKEELTKVLQNKFLMEPEKTASKEYVKNYYEKIADVSKQIEDLLTSAGKENSNLMKDVSAMKDNMNFMNQMNELYNYVQLPLKMANAQANGDLYVYAKKKGQAGGGDEDGPLTALLHLSMETLGNMDIFLKLEHEKLSTDFCLEKEEMIDFIEEHIDELNARLIKKGYNIETKVMPLKDKDRTVIDTIKSETPGITLLSNQSFDARA